MAVGGVGARTRDDASCAVMGVTALLLALAGFASFVLQQLADEPDACFADVVVTPPKDARAYRVFELDNGLRALVVSDAQADVAAAAMSVGVGSLFDPPETAGLAHFLEHMLFTGNARYPREGEYFDFVNAHGGSTNAATGLERTHFHFSIPPAQLLPALERLLQFFISPTLAPGMTEREKHAVSAEHSKNVAQDEWRFQRIRFLTTGNPACALHKFGTGNLATLANASSDQLRAFYDAHYAPRAMGLAVVGRESLDRLEAAVRSLASHMPKKAAVTPTFDDAPGPLPPYPAHGLVAGSADARGRAVGGRQVEFEPVADAQALRLVWYLPPMRGEYARKSLAYVTELLGDEGPGSLVSLLRAERGWADALTAGASHPASFFSEVEVSISLTSDGLEHVDDVVELVFAAIGKIRATPPERWRWEEDRQLAEIEWRFLEPAQPAALAQDLSAALLDKDVPLCDALRGPYAYRHFDSAQISTVAAQLTADTLLLYVGAKGLSRGVPDAGPASALDFGTDSGWVREKYYGARFRVRPFSPEQLRAWRGADAARVAAGGEGAGGVGADLRLPPPNAFIPTDFSLVVPAAPAGSAASLTVAPELLDDSTTGRLWLYADGTFAQPRASVTCVVTAGAVLADARALWTTQLLISMATDALKERAYPAAIAGLAASVGVGIEGLELSASGFSHKLTRLLQMAASTVAPGATVRASRFEAVRAAIVRDLRAEQFAGSLANALTQLKVLVRARTASYDRLAAVRIVANLTIDDVRAHATRLVSAGSYTECLVAGNVREQHALGAFATVRAALGGPPLASGALANLRQRVLSVPVGDHLWQADALDPDEINSAVALYYEARARALCVAARRRVRRVRGATA